MNRALAMAFALCGGVGCLGARTTVVAPDASVPVSLSRAVLDENGVLVSRERRTLAGRYHAKRTAYSLGWSLIPLNAKTDLSKSLIEQVLAVHGDAVSNLTVKVGHCPWNVLFLPFGAVPIWPGCAEIEVNGDIIRVAPLEARRQDPSPADASASPLLPQDSKRLRFAPTSEAGDEQLHDLCTYVGVTSEQGEQRAQRDAAERRANVIEPVSEGTAKLFACP